MKKQEITLPVSVAKESALSLWLKKDNRLYSLIMSRSISNAQVLRITHVEIAGTVAIFSPSAGAITCTVCAGWFAISLYLCKKGGVR